MNKKLLLTLLFTILSFGQLLAGHANHYGKVIAHSTGNGKVYAISTSITNINDISPEDWEDNKSTSMSFTCGGDKDKDTQYCYVYARPNDRYHFAGWAETETKPGTYNSTETTYLFPFTVSGTSDSLSIVNIYAYFEPNTSSQISFTVPVNGSYVAEYPDETIRMDGTSSLTSKVSIENFNLTATPAEGYKCFGWYTLDNDGVSKSYFSYEKTVSAQYFESGTSIGVTFVEESQPIFVIKGKENVLYNDLKEANDAANGNGTIVLLGDGTLPSGNYTISKGVTLLIPYDSSSSLFETEPVVTHDFIQPFAYRTLTLADGVSINVEGAISVSACLLSGGTTKNQSPGVVTGGYGHILMHEGSKINLNKGSNLYAWGYITGQGCIEANSGSTVYENFQIMDWRGGSCTSTMQDNIRKVFPCSQYYIQNIESTLVINYGAIENVYTSVYVSTQQKNASVELFGNNGLFVLQDGASLVKSYDPSTDRILIDLYGKMGHSSSLNSIDLKIGGFNLTSSDYVLPIVNNWTINVNTGTVAVTNDVAILPGVIINVAEDAIVNVESGKSMYLYDSASWKNRGFTYSNSDFKPIGYSPTIHYTRTTNDLVNAKLNINGTLNVDGYLYTTYTESSCADITSDNIGVVVMNNATGTPTTTYQATQSGTTPTYVEIPVKPALLKNCDDSYTQTAGTSADVSYHYVNGYWLSDDIEIAVYKPGQSESTSVKLNEWAETQKSTPNAIAVIDATDNSNNNYAEKLTNMVVDNNCPNFVLTDKSPVDVPFEFTASNATYSRANTKYNGELQWGTICLPFAVESDDNIQYYQLSEMTEHLMTFTPVDAVEANTPAIFSVVSDDSREKVEINASDVTVPVTNEGTVSAGGLMLHGVLKDVKVLQADVNSAEYFIAQNKFWRPTESNTNIRPMRAYFTSSAAPEAKMFDIVVGEDDETTYVKSALEPTYIEGVYDANGIKRNGIQKGLNIIRFSNGKTQKIIIK